MFETCGDVRICKVFRAGEWRGLSLQCNRHRNATDAPGVECTKDLTLADGLTVEEAVRRLKRWYVAGLHEDGWPAGSARAEHLKLGGRLLRHFADTEPGWGDMSMDDLDFLIRGHIA